MKHLFIFSLLLACAGSVMAQGLLPMPKYHRDITFYVSFDDETPNADICNGRERPVDLLGKPLFKEGIRGKAFYGGEGSGGIRYQRKDNLTIGSSGTVVFFFKGDFKNGKKGSGIFLWGIDSGRGYLGQVIVGWPKERCPCERGIQTQFLEGKKIPNKHISTETPDGDKGCGKWHMYAFSWAPGQVSVKYDLNPAKNYPISFDMGESDFPADHFTLGRQTGWNYYMDEFTVYNRRLSDAELNEIYKMYMNPEAAPEGK